MSYFQMLTLILWLTSNSNQEMHYSYQPSKIILYQGTALKSEYLDSIIDIAIIMEQKTGVPVSVQIAVDLLESGYDKDKTKYNNNGWITCKCNYSKRLRNKHKNLDICFLAYDEYANRWCYFKKYKTVEECWEDKARIISKYKWFKPNQSFEYYSKHLQGCYAESKKYTESLNKINNWFLKDFRYEILYL